MPPFRIAITDEDATFQWRKVFDSESEAEAQLSEAKKEFPKRDVAVEELVETTPPSDDGTGGQHEWRAI